MRRVDKYRKFITPKHFTPASHQFYSYRDNGGPIVRTTHQREILGICLHYTAGTAPYDFMIMTGQTKREVSSTFYVAPEKGARVEYFGDTVFLEPGEVVMTLDPEDFPWTQGVLINGPQDKKHPITTIKGGFGVNPNVYDISFEISNIGWLYDPDHYVNTERFQPYGPRQIDNIVTALADVCLDYDIPYDSTHIHSHEALDTWKSDPGPKFPFGQVEERVKAAIRSEEDHVVISEVQAQALAQEIWDRGGLDLNLDHAIPKYWFEQLLVGNNLGSPMGYEVDANDKKERSVVSRGNLYMPAAAADGRELLVAFFQNGILWCEKGVWQVFEGMPPVEGT